MADLVEFLKARLDEDERVTYNPAFMPVSGPGLSGLVKRARAEIEAKRRIIELHARIPDDGINFTWAERDRAEETLRLLALPYADHPDYDPTWAVTRERA